MDGRKDGWADGWWNNNTDEEIYPMACKKLKKKKTE